MRPRLGWNVRGFGCFYKHKPQLGFKADDVVYVVCNADLSAHDLCS